MKLPSGNVSETLFVPLWGRAESSKKYPSLLDDKESIRIVESSNYDFSKVNSSSEYYCLASAIRAANFDRELREYINAHPEASIVSIGSGLDTTFFRVDNGKIFWYDLDLPEIIELRKKYVTDNERIKMIAGSCFDYEWISRV
ncbi:MAG: class I SAM-dependent methyltransferase, partial [Spirochaetales bacterium]|nr:class I SAM-dependent methyltransferase [Spirochaetales bacterium]